MSKHIQQIGQLILADADGVMCEVSSDLCRINGLTTFNIRNPETGMESKVEVRVSEIG